ncbi:hypothetical protein [Nitrospirillum pindoramense]|uniref:Uncharacterized protein n=1 Tax=Nitrospirillum amazonense TaxID=28077 RepID=A0A560H5R4_9PROT|nr:hypothetical protein [Nitrospirillum amazonense]TWB41633.1 hypothetical protein FBZ90_1073 [Nitrospirillum amazonense]
MSTNQSAAYARILQERIADLDPLIERWSSDSLTLTDTAGDEAEEYLERLKVIRAEMAGRLGRPDLDIPTPGITDSLLAR